MGKEIITQVQETQSPRQDKPKAKLPKTHIKQINKDQTQRANIKSSKRKATNNTQGNFNKGNQLIFLQKLCSLEGSGKICLKRLKGKAKIKNTTTYELPW